MTIVMGMQILFKIYQKVQGIGPVSLFSEFEPQQNLDLSQYHLTISLATSCQYQCYYNVLHSSTDRAIFTFQNLELGKASTDKNVISQSLGLDLFNINVYAKVYQNIPFSSRDRAIFTFSEFGTQQSLDQR